MRIGAFARGRYWRARRRLDEFGARARALTRLAKLPAARARMALDPQPLSEFWGHDRGTPIHRYYLAQFLQQHAADIQGHCLEFQEDSYTSRFGGERISKLDILHIDASNPNATIIADLTRPNAVPSDTFDCIVCTHVLHLVGEVDALVRDLHRILKPGGVMLVASPQIACCNRSTRMSRGGVFIRPMDCAGCSPKHSARHPSTSGPTGTLWWLAPN